MNYKDFFSKFRSGELPRVLLLEGEEEYTKDSALHQIRRKILPEGLEELNETPLGAQSTAGEIVDACETLPFLSPLRLVVVRDSPLVLKTPGASRDDGLDRLLAYIADLPAHVFLVFFCRGKADRTRKAAARIDSLGGRVDFAPLDAKDKSIWLSRELKAHGKTMDRRAADLFLSRVDPLLTPTLQELQKVLAFVGDGINDAPVLSRADVGIAMGGLGSDAAIEAADVVLMDDKPSKIALAVRIARRTLRIARQNVVFALAVKGIMLLMGAFGVANLWEAVFADVGVSVIAILNAMRALSIRPYRK